jgi:hypothetical protein
MGIVPQGRLRAKARPYPKYAMRAWQTRLAYPALVGESEGPAQADNACALTKGGKEKERRKE